MALTKGAGHHHKGCPEYRKSTNRDKVEKQFEDQLKSMEPSPKTHALATQMFKDAWEKRTNNVQSEAKRLRTRANQAERGIEAVLDRIVRTGSDVTVAAYEKRISELQSEKTLFEEEAQKIATPWRDFDEMFELSKRFLANPYYIWKNGNLAVK
jgi:site-specific DNA recombinase